jgi:hypothetical protein
MFLQFDVEKRGWNASNQTLMVPNQRADQEDPIGRRFISSDDRDSRIRFKARGVSSALTPDLRPL